MPAQKHSVTSPAVSDEDNNNNNNNNNNHNNNDSPVQHIEDAEELPQADQSDSDGSGGSSGGGDKDEYITVSLADIRKEVQCPICLGIIRKTRTVMECLHRFCRECIDKSMRLGNNECPACRTHCASRRSLRDDPNYDALIAALYPDIDKYEEEELAFHEEERTRYKKIQEKIAQTQRRQSEALGNKKKNGRATAAATAAAFARRSQAYRSSRSRRNQRAIEQQGSDEEDYANDRDRVAGSADGGDENHPEVNRDSLGASAGLVGNSEMLAWGGGGIRSNTRHSNQNAGNTRIARSTRLARLLESYQNTVEEDTLNIHLMLVPWDEQRLPSLERPHMRCEAHVSIRHVCQYVASNTVAEAEEIEILLVQQNEVLCILEGHETLGELQAMYGVTQRDMRFAYRLKVPASMNSV
ncbi:putative E3 ubiquitin-protein ligase RING1a [Heracleum sosnowskyi]|uniref:E3 ubiquitin-protein ligase RING1a n=1 Tax=Heracleum sosnowskyi TaxID=360622 RepID=A0AAD8HXM0_9APIA|nr:putative E3 ubiquitin-protein ligase RING1a [Heracleum sosnowskyi]